VTRERDGLKADLAETGAIHARLLAEYEALKRSSASSDALEDVRAELAAAKVGTDISSAICL
jgi:hypothetical protein